MEKRLLLAFVLSAAIFMVWSVLFPPPTKRLPMAGSTPAAEKQAPAEATPAPTAAVAAAEHPVPQGGTTDAQGRAGVGTATSGDPKATEELDNGLIHLVVGARGGAVESLVLDRYDDDEGRPLELVQKVDLSTRALPLQLVGEGGPDGRVYELHAEGLSVRLRYSDGRSQEVIKTISLEKGSYTVGIQVEIHGADGYPWIAVGTGMRNVGPLEKENRFATWGDAVVLSGDKVEKYHRKKVKEPLDIPGTGVVFAGFQDTYFLNVMEDSGRFDAVRIVPLQMPAPAVDETTVKGKKKKKIKAEDLRVLQVLVRPKAYPFEAELFTAPKEYDLLQKVDHGVEKTLHFGIFHPISVVFLKVLRWIQSYVGNWGLAIILLTLGIRILLFPLMHTSTVSMRKMQKIQPKVKAIQEKYKKSKSDPQARTKMNQEVMELYKVEGVNPMGGCLPMLIQLPILWALYTLFAYAIELRHAPFIFWITDLSAKDPYYITPILMTFTMWLQQKLAPQAGDPQQQKMFRMMPLIFGIMFLGFPSGLVLYWLTNNVLTIVQQEVTLHLIGERQLPGTKRGGSAKGKRKGKRS
ncbi:MAG: membrane protein insertase YidC [Acidobacteria bacterium]|nr:membrane protein insertase YidC [Acidobacteriota bacterium]